MRFGLILHHSEVFPDEEVPGFHEVFQDLPTKLAIEYFTWMSSRLHLNPMSDSNQQVILRELSHSMDWKRYKKFNAAVTRQFWRMQRFYMFDAYPMLHALNYLIQNKNTDERTVPNETNKDKEIIFNSILVANQIINDEYKKNTILSDDRLKRFCQVAWPNLSSSSNHRMRFDFELLSYKAVTFIDYILGMEDQTIANHYMSYFNIATKEDAMFYVTDILAFYLITGLNKEGIHFHHAFTYNVEKENPIISKFVLKLDEYDVRDFNSKDFKTLRETPVIKLRENRYNIVHWNFLLDKLGVGFLFELFFKTELHTQYLDKKKQPRFDTFKSTVGFYYSEKLFQKVLAEAVVKLGDFYNPGNPEGNDNSDSYLRRGNKIALFEFKDVLIVKHTEYEQIEREIDKKLNSEGKGTYQLAKLLDKLEADVNTFEQGLSKTRNKRKLVVYPILIVTESLFSAPGFPQYLNRSFQTLISNKKYSFYIRPLVTIDFDFFLQFYDLFKTGKIDLFSLIEYNFFQARKFRRRAIGSINHQEVAKEFNGFVENVSPLISRKLNNKRKSGTLGSYAIGKLNLNKRKY